MKQKHDEIEKAYTLPDPWGYQKSPEDIKRKNYFLGLIKTIHPAMFSTALDIGAGEGWITKDLPAYGRYGYEVSNIAASRFPLEVTRTLEPMGKYDLVVATGVLYDHYEWEKFVDFINAHTGKIAFLSNIESWEKPEAIKKIAHKQIFEARFPYNEHFQKVRIYCVS